MPRKAKEEINEKVNSKKVATSKKTTSKKAIVSKESIATNQAENIKTKKKNSVAKKSTTAQKKTTDTSKKLVSDSKTSTRPKKSASSKKASTISKGNAKTSKAKVSKKSSSSKKKPTKSSKKMIIANEYYDLPASYNQTVVKILAQTPSCLFVYWEVSKEDKLKIEKEHGDDFFKNSKPFLIVVNEEMNYSFEIEINDYANSWYIPIHDSNCKYIVKLIRKPINFLSNLSTSFVNITSSNEMSLPNNHILFDKLGKTVFFRNVKTSALTEKNISSLSFISNIGRIYNIYDLYKEIYKNELNGDELGIKLSSSSFSSTFK